MPNNTFEDYKLAVKKKYEIEKNSSHFVYLNNPTRARLRNLCWELFQQQNRNQDDLNVFSSLLGLTFDVNKKNKFDEQIDKFRPIDSFFKGETDPSNVDAVNMAAILVDFKGRPFNKFRIQSLFEDEVQNETEKSLELSNPKKEQIESSGDLETFIEEKEREKGIERGTENEKERVLEREKDIEFRQPKSINLFVNVKEKVLNRFRRKIKITAIGVAVILCIGFAVIYEFFPRKGCMQWSENRYEIVDCDLKAPNNTIELLDPTLVNLKKITVCDTTTYFDKNGVAIIWYAKSANGVDFFNVHGRHPENNHPLRPVTHYILDKYVKK